MLKIFSHWYLWAISLSLVACVNLERSPILRINHSKNVKIGRWFELDSSNFLLNVSYIGGKKYGLAKCYDLKQLTECRFLYFNDKILFCSLRRRRINASIRDCRQGIWIEFSSLVADDTVSCYIDICNFEENFKDGISVSLSYPKCELSSVIHYKNGLKHGFSDYYCGNDVLIGRNFYKKDSLIWHAIVNPRF